MLERLDTDYIDLLYLHQAVGDYMAGWRGLEDAVKKGKVRAKGNNSDSRILTLNKNYLMMSSQRLKLNPQSFNRSDRITPVRTEKRFQEEMRGE